MITFHLAYFENNKAMYDTSILSIPIDALVVLVGPAGSGKSDFANKHFDSTQIVSSDECRAFVGDDSSRMDVSREAFDVMMNIMRHRLRLGHTTVADSTALNPQIRRQFLKLAKKYRRPAIAVLFDTSRDQCLEHNKERSRQVPEKVIYEHHEQFQHQKDQIKEDESFDEVYTISAEQFDDVMLRLRNTEVRKDYEGSLDIISDIHGCLDELKDLLEKLGYERGESGYAHPEERKVVFTGDIANRGPENLGTLALVMEMVAQNNAFYIPGNHCNKLYKHFLGHDVNEENGLEKTLDELQELPEEEQNRFKERFQDLYEMSPPYLIFDDGNLVVTHGGIRDEDIGKVNEEVAQFSLHGDTNEQDTTEDGYPIRREWPLRHQGDELIVYGHSPTEKATFVNNTINLDQGAVYGGYLTALQYPERDLVHTKSEQDYADHDYDSIQELVNARSDPYFHMDLLKGDCTVQKDDKIIDISEKTMIRGIERITESDLSLSSQVYLPSEPARAIPSTPVDNQMSESCSEMMEHFDSKGIEEIRIIRESHGMIPSIALCTKSASASQKHFGHPFSNILYDKKGKLLAKDTDFLDQIQHDLFDLPWVSDQEDTFIVEGLWTTGQKPLDKELHWISNDRKELTDVVDKLRDASPNVGAVKTVLKDLEVIHSELGRNIEKLTRKRDTEQSGKSEEETPLFIPIRFVSTNEQVLLGTAKEIPSSNMFWGQKEDLGNHVSTLSVQDAESFLSMWSSRQAVNAWWILPRYQEGEKWNPDIIPAFRLVGKKRWKLAELISPRRWWGRDSSAKWAGWNSSKEIFALGHECARRFVGKLHPSYRVQSIAAHAGLSHW